MENIVANGRFVTLLIHTGDNIGPDGAEKLVRSALESRGIGQWRGMSIELVCGGEEALLMARPASGISVYVADYALPYFNGLFTE